MTTGATGQLGLALPVQGELSGTWGDTVNNGITQYTNIAIAGTLTLTGDGAVTLANTTGDASASNITSTLTGAGTVTAQFAIVRVTGTLTVAKVVTGPAYSKTYTVVNAATGGIVTFKAAGQTGVSVAVGESAFVYFNGTDYVKLVGTATAGAAGGSNTQVQFNSSGVLAGSANMTFNGTTLTVNDLTDSSLTTGRVVYTTTGGNLVDSANLLYSGTDLTVYGVTVGRGNGAVSSNTAVGASALAANTTGADNTALGLNALASNNSGINNTASGRFALTSNTIGVGNTASGYSSLATNISGSYNTASGGLSLYSNTGSYNTAVGYDALNNNTASNNTAVGYQAGYTNTTNGANSFFGGLSGYNSTGVTNTYIGYGAGYSMTSGGKNAIIGGYNGNQDGLDIRTASNYAVISDGDGNRLLSTANGQTLALDGGAVPNAGTGITFPATQSASSDANTLDDYEEGSWTPVITSSSGSLTAYTSSGTYTKIGRSVTVTFNAVITTPGTASDKMDISGFPFTNGNGYQTPTLCREMTNTGTAYQAFINASATTGHVRSLTEGAISWTTNSRYVFFITYVV